jgi:hypothetical protein
MYQQEQLELQKKQKLKEAAKTLRRLPIFGYSEQNGFEWPKAQDILAGKTDKPIKVVSFTYRT